MKLKVEYIPINEITPYEKNAKIHTEEQIEQIKKSIEEFGMNDPIGIWGKDNIIIEGHGRLMALQELGWTEVPVIRLDDLTDEQRRAYTLIHNQTTMNTGFNIDILNEELANIDLDMSFFGFDEIEEPEIEINDDDFEFEEPEEEPKSKRGEIYKLGNHYLMCGDSTNPDDVEKLMNGAVADLVVTDPPYNVAVSNSQGMTIENDDMSDKDFKEFLNKSFYNLSNKLKQGGAFYVWYATNEEIDKEVLCDQVKIINPLGEWTGGTDVDTGATNRKLGSDMAQSVTGGGLHGKDLSKADVSVNIYAFLKAQKTGETVELCCAIGDDTIDDKPYSEIVEIAREYINKVGGFEKFAEWGLF